MNPKPLYLALFASIASLVAVLIAQYGFGLIPCELCQLQRIPYVVVIFLALLGLYRPRHRLWIIGLIGLTFLAGSGIAAYHTGVEKQWIAGPIGCTDSGNKAGQSMDDFLKKIEHAPIVACNQSQWDFHGLTMAGMNAFWSLFLACNMFVALQQLCKRKHSHA